MYIISVQIYKAQKRKITTPLKTHIISVHLDSFNPSL